MTFKKTALMTAAIVTSGAFLPVANTAFASEDEKNERYEHCEDRKGGGWFGKKERRHHGMHGMRAMKRMFPKGEINLTTDRLREIAEGFIAFSGNENLKVGDVSEVDTDKLKVDIVTQDGSLVESFEVVKKTGHFTPVR